MNNSFKKIDFKDTKVIALGLSLLILIIMIISFIVYNKKKNINQNTKDLTRLTEEYNIVNEQKNNYKPSAYIPEDKRDIGATDQEGNKVFLPSEEYKIDIPKTFSNQVSETNRGVVDKLVLDLTEIINKNDVNKLYDMLNKDYIDDLDINEELFKSGYKYNGAISSTIFNVEMGEDMKSLIISVNIKETNTGLQQIRYFTLFEGGTIADMPFYNVKKENIKKAINDVDYTIKTRYDSRLSTIISINIKNNSSYLLDVKEIVTKLNNTIYSNKIISLNRDVKVYPGSPFQLTLEVPNYIGLSNIILKCVDIEGKQFDVDLIGAQ